MLESASVLVLAIDGFRSYLVVPSIKLRAGSSPALMGVSSNTSGLRLRVAAVCSTTSQRR